MVQDRNDEFGEYQTDNVDTDKFAVLTSRGAPRITKRPALVQEVTDGHGEDKRDGIRGERRHPQQSGGQIIDGKTRRRVDHPNHCEFNKLPGDPATRDERMIGKVGYDLAHDQSR